MSSLFGKAADEIINAHEQVYSQLMKGASIMLDGMGSNGPIIDDSAKNGRTVEFDGEGMRIEDMEDTASPLEGIADSVMGDIMRGQVGPQTPMEHISAFQSAINWSEPFICCIIAFQVFVFVATIYVCKKKNLAARIILLVFIGVFVKSSEYLNMYASRHWEDFASQNYFDERGIFAGIMLSAPMLLNAFIMLISFMREAVHLLVEVKTMELKNKARNQGKASGKNRKSKKSDTTTQVERAGGRKEE